ncbi:serine/threonine protein phosphatase [Ruminococcus sp.]|uniref:serine/threonine protein phosphatase n=1 Tax=Ruminococcus sp. TaxID=41978 RepID=UPI0025FFCE19|nr:serine/threonine protein phosphatase [Ruminococcus sp.]MBQ8965943.1 serine/threonine protein phosphatase [Ruminococcus sp.]
MKIFGRKEKEEKAYERQCFSAAAGDGAFRMAADTGVLEGGIYDGLRATVPVIDACFGKIIRLTGDFRVRAKDERYQEELEKFCREVTVGISGKSLNTFADMYLDSLLTYGRAVGRIVTDKESMTIRGLAVGDSSLFRVRQGRGELDKEFLFCGDGREVRLPEPEKLLYTVLNPSPRHPDGVSILRGLPAISGVLMRIYQCIGQNFDRVGNVRYAVTYKPAEDGSDKRYAAERAQEIARAWADGMQSAKNGIVKDFITVGDVGIKVIGAENQLIDTEVPVRQLLEQLVAKLSVPPFLLGLNWSTTERMSSQQADILTSELEYYRRLLGPVLSDICDAFLKSCGTDCGAEIEWENINLQDEEALARSRLYNAQARKLELENEETENRRSRE